MKSVAWQSDSIGESLLSANHFGFIKDAWRRPAAGGYPNRLCAENEDARGRGGSCGARAVRSLALSQGVAFHR
jgi:hypothetical protein